MLRDRYDKQKACRTAHKFFGKGNANFVAIDGTEYSKPMFDMVVFFAGAYSCEGNITFLEEQEEKFTVIYNDKFISQVGDISSCLPIYINEIPQIDHTLDSASINNNSVGPLTDDVIINNLVLRIS